MRIIAGKYKKANLASVAGTTSRPTTDFTKELIFSTIGDCSGAKTLDIYAGTGGLGLEALSRGAEFVDFVEFSSKAIAVIFQNVKKLRCEENCHIHRRKADSFLNKTETKYDLILMDPPYEKSVVNSSLKLIMEKEILADNGWLVIEHSAKEKIDEMWHSDIVSQKKIGNTNVTFIRKKNENL